MIRRKQIEKSVEKVLEDLGIPKYIQISLIPVLTETFINNHVSFMSEVGKDLDRQREALHSEINKLEKDAENYWKSGLTAHREATIQLIGVHKGRIVELNLLEHNIKEESKISDEEFVDEGELTEDDILEAL